MGPGAGRRNKWSRGSACALRNLSENVFDLVAEFARPGLLLILFEFGKLLKQPALFAVESGRSQHGGDDEQVAAPVPLQ